MACSMLDSVRTAASLLAARKIVSMSPRSSSEASRTDRRPLMRTARSSSFSLWSLGTLPCGVAISPSSPASSGTSSESTCSR